MTIGQPQVAASSQAASEEAAPRPSSTPPPWSVLWQTPLGIASVAIIILALLYARRHAPGHDFDGVLAQIATLSSEGRVVEAAQSLREKVLPHLGEATEAQQAKAKALAGDLAWLSAHQRGTATTDDWRLVHERYEEARSLRWVFSPAQIERWAASLVALGEPAEARRRLSLLDDADDEGDANEAAAVRARVSRLIARSALERPGLGLEERLQLLQEHRAGATDASEIVWSIVRQAELRIEAGHPREAIDRLLVDLRRSEPQIESEGVSIAEVQAVLARGYLELGETDFAESLVTQALGELESTDPARQGALVTLGRIHASRGQHEEALESFSEAAEADPAGEAWAAAMLGRADMSGVLGRHEEALTDYRRLQEAMSRRTFGWGVTPGVAMDRLSDRHDAALATRQFDLALAYIEVASSFTTPDRTPEPVLRRLATAHRVVADTWMAQAMDAAGEVKDQAARVSASRHYRLAAQAFLARAKALHASPTQEAAWAESMWQAADCFDLAGYHEDAIRQFELFVMSRSEQDTRWLDGTWRLARCRQAVGDLRGAAALYEEIIRANPNSVVAARSHVPLAACYVGLGTPSLAEQQLLRVVSGAEPLRPTAADFQEALVALGTLYHETGEYTRAIEMLERAIASPAIGARLSEVRFRLADSYRLAARRLAEASPGDLALSSGQGGSGTEAARTVLRREHLSRAMTLFEQVIEAEQERPMATRTELEREQVRLAHLYVADCAYELADYDRAIVLYDRAAQRYADHASSVTALIQIVNAYGRLGDRSRALAAHNRVLHKLEQMPEDALTGEAGVLDEAAWRSWLELMPPGTSRRAGVDNP